MASDENTPGGGEDAGSDEILANPVYNWLSVIGAAVAIAALTAAVFFFLIGFVTKGGTGYSGLVFLPPAGIVVVGVLMFIAGWTRERRRQRRGEHSSFHQRYVIDPSRLIRGVSWVTIGSGIVVGTLAVLSGGAGALTVVQYTASNEFCGETCHSVMAPEATVFADSAHSQLDCVECHVGSSGDSFIAAKVNGLAQVYSLLTGSVERPIPTPVHNLRDSKEMCGACHATDRLNEYKAVSHSYFLASEEAERVGLRMMMKVGSGDSGPMHGRGIHYHMLIARNVEYVARDAQRQDIPWVRVTEADGTERVFENESDPLSDEDRAALPVRAMECVDCHSRPAHRFPSPVESVNAAFSSGRLDPDIPYLKAAAVIALDGDYASTEEAMEGIPERLREWYDEEYPDELEDYSDEIDETVPELLAIYRRTIFPEMKADWRAHPDNSGHTASPGCFRCHNDEMVDEDGEAMFHDCSSCHAILAQGEQVAEAVANFETGTAFVHPEDFDEIDEFTLCTDCHTGGAYVYE
jgi:hypothetical protein